MSCEGYFSLLDIIIWQVENRFLKQSFQQVVNAEELLLTAAKGEDLNSHMKKLCLFYDDFDSSIVAAMISEGSSSETLNSEHL